MGHNAILTTNELIQATGYDREGDLKRALSEAGIVWFPGKGGRPWTTIALINKAGGLFPQSSANEPIMLGPDDV